MDSYNLYWPVYQNLEDEFLNITHFIHFDDNQLNKRGTSGSKWKRAYQAIKHNRFNNFKQGNLYNCINSLAALYILNIYYKNTEYELGNEKGVNNFDLLQGSKIFSIKTCKCDSFDGKVKNDDESIYIINYTDSFIAKWNENNILLNKTLIEEIIKDSKFIDELNNKKVSLKDLSDFTKIQNIIGTNKYVEHLKAALRKSNINNLISNQQFHAYLNKNNN